MKRNYKLAANFNVVEFEITDDNILEELTDEELQYDENDEVYFTDEAKKASIKRILQREYDLLSSIKVINVAPPIKQSTSAPVDPPSPKMIEWATNLGMKNPETQSKKAVWEFIQKNKKN